MRPAVVALCLTLLLYSAEAAFQSYFFTNSSYVVSPSGKTLRVKIGQDDLNAIKQLTSLATTLQTSYISVLAQAVDDLSGNPVLAATVQASNFTPNFQRPMLNTFSLNMDAGTLSLYFSEAINASSLLVNHIQLQADGQAVGSVFTLTGGTVSALNPTALQISLTLGDINIIKSLVTLAKDVNSTFISFDNATLADLQGNLVVDVAPSNALRASQYVADSTPPQLLSTGLNLNTDELFLVFSETINTTSIDPTSIWLQCNANRSSGAFVRLSGGQVSNINLTTIKIALLQKDINQVLAKYPCFMSTNTAFISITTSLATDMVSLPVVPIAAGSGVAVAFFVQDGGAPSLVSFNFSATSGLLTLIFSKTVSTNTFQPNKVVLQAQQNGTGLPATLVYPLQNSFAQASYSTNVVVQLSVLDLNAIKYHFPKLAFGSSTTFISATTGFVRDTRNNNAVAIDASAGMQAQSYEFDSIAPSVSSVALDMSAGSITLVFPEPLNMSSFNAAALTLQDNATATQSYTLTGTYNTTGALVETSFASTFLVTLTLLNFDLDSIKALYPLASSLATSYFTFTSNLVTDTTGNAVAQVANGNGLQAISYTTDNVAPKLLSFDVNMNQQFISLTFSETVRANTLHPTSFTLQNAQSLAGATQNVTLTTSTTSSPNNPIITLQFSTADVNVIKAVGGLCTGLSNCYLSLDSGAIADMAGNAVVAIDSGSGMAVRNFTADTTPPQLTSFTLDMNAGVLGLTFSEPVYLASAHATAYTLQSTANGNQVGSLNLTLTGGGFSAVDSVRTQVALSLTTADLNEIKRLNGLAVGANSTFLSITSQAMSDMQMIGVVNISKLAALPVAAGGFTRDTTPPTLVSFTLNMNTTVLTMVFDETIRHTSVVFSRISLQSVPQGDLYTLQGGSVVSADGVNVVIQLDVNDVNSIKLNPNMATMESNTMLVLSGSAVQDMANNGIVSTTATVAPGGFVRDSISPRLVSFAVNMNTTTLTLNFDEPVNASSVDTQSTVRLSNARNATGNDVVLLSSATSSTSNGLQLTLTMTPADANKVKANRNLYVSSNSSYLSVLALLVQDMAGNALAPIALSQALVATSFIQDTTQPYVVAFGLDMTSGLVTLQFSETVDTNTFNVTGLTLQTSASVVGASSANYQLTLTGGSWTSTPGPNVTVVLSTADLNELKRKQIGLSQATAWLTMSSTTVSSMSGQAVIALVNGATALNAATYVADTISPTLSSVGLSMSTGVLTLVFSETVKAATFNASSLTLQSSRVQGALWYTLNGACSTTNSVDGTTIVATICTDDLNAIKALYPLAGNATLAYVSFDSGLITDMVGLSVVPVTAGAGLLVSSYTTDTVAPQLSSFSLDMRYNTVVLSLTFSETVNTQTLSLGQLTLQLAAGVSSAGLPQQYTLSGGVFTSGYSTSVAINLTDTDANAIKGLPGLAKDSGSTFVTIGSGLIKDVFGNAVTAIVNGSGLGVHTYRVDVTPPVLRGFSLNLTSAVVTLTFSETVLSGTLQTAGLEFRNSSCGGEAFVLTGGTVVRVGTYDSPVVVVTLTQVDVNAIEFDRLLLTSQATTYLHFLPGNVRDAAHLAILDAAPCSYVQASTYVPDNNAPVLSSFDVDWTAGTLALLFSKTVDVSTFTVTSLLLQVSLNASTQYRLTSGSVNRTSAVSLLVTLTTTDLNNIKLTPPLFSRFNTSFISTVSSPALIYDYFGNALVTISSSLALAANTYVGDSTPISLTSFDLNVNAGVLTLHFSKPVQTSTLDVTALSLAVSPSVSPSFTFSSSSVSNTSVAFTQTLSILVSLSDLNTIKRLYPLASAANFTYLSARLGLVLDVALNTNAVVSGQAVSQYVADTTSPALQAFSANMDAGTLRLSFSETVNAGTLNVTGITLQSNQTVVADITKSWTLTNSVVASGNSDVIVVSLSDFDLNNLKRIRGLARSQNSTFLALVGSAISDMVGNGVVAVPTSAALQVSAFSADVTVPTLNSWDLLMDPYGPPLKIVLHFSETVDANTLDFTGVGLQNTQTQQAQTASYSLHGGEAVPLWP